MSVKNIQQFCKLLSAYNVVRVELYYDGSGDSGDFETIQIITIPTPAQIDLSTQQTSNTTAVTVTEKRTNGHTWAQDTAKKENSLITVNAFDEFVSDVFDLLPGGWEINDGSYGDIVVDVAEESVKIDHNERYTEVRSETFDYR
jgi:hypothetical protein